MVSETYLVPGRCVIGRTADNDLQVDNKFVSRHHAQVVTTADGSWIEDLNSTNGIFVQRQAGAPRTGSPTATIVKIGTYELVYARAGRAACAAAPQGDATHAADEAEPVAGNRRRTSDELSPSVVERTRVVLRLAVAR